MSEDRKLAVLRAIVEDYVQTREPVGSRALVERHSLGVSPATIRNDMAALEEEGLHRPAAHQRRADPHRQGVPALRRPAARPSSRCRPRRSGPSRPSSTARSTSTTSSTGPSACSRTLTRQVAVVQYPSLTRSTVRHVELVPIGGRSAARRPHHEHRPGRAARRRGRHRAERGAARRAPGPAQRGGQRAAAHRCRDPRHDAAGGVLVRRPGARRDRARRRSRTPSRSSARSGSCSPGPPTSRAPAPTSPARSGRSSRRSRSRSSCSSCCRRWPRTPRASAS